MTESIINFNVGVKREEQYVSRLKVFLSEMNAFGGLSDGYIKFDTTKLPARGLISETIQYHGFADLYNLNGARAVAEIYADAQFPAGHPAITVNEVGANSGIAAAFTYDLARSVIVTVVLPNNNCSTKGFNSLSNCASIFMASLLPFCAIAFKIAC